MKKDFHFPCKEPLVALIGPTAIGKTALSIELAKEFDFEIISVDSMQVYKYMDIGTAKVTSEEMQGIRHHLIDVVTPDQDFDASNFEQNALVAVQDIQGRGKRVLLTGGTGLYLRSLLEGLSRQLPTFPEIRAEIQLELEREGRDKLHEQLLLIDRTSGERIHMNDTQRLVRAIEVFRGTGKKWSEHIAEHQASKQLRFENTLCIGLTCERKQLYKRIGLRSEIMLDAGFKEEVKALVKRGYGEQHKSMRSIGYNHMLKLLNGEWDYETMLEKLTRDTRRYAKRQYTWFNKIEDINWFEKTESNRVGDAVGEYLNNVTSMR